MAPGPRGRPCRRSTIGLGKSIFSSCDRTGARSMLAAELTSSGLAELMSYEIEVMAELASEKLLVEVVAGEDRIDLARAGVGTSVLRHLGRRPE